MNKLDHRSRLILFAGPNGSGKTTITIMISRHKLVPKLYLNPDDIAREINPDDPWKVRLAAGRKAAELRKAYLERNKSFAMETTLSGALGLSFIKDAISRGYKVTAIFVAVQGVLENIARVETRIKQGGHSIPPDVIARRRERSLKNLPFLIDNLSQVIVIDNTKKPRTIFSKNDKIIFISSVLPNWFTSSISNDKIKEYHLEVSKLDNMKDCKLKK